MPIQYYKRKNQKTGVNDFIEKGTDRYIGPTEYGDGSNFEEVKNTPRLDSYNKKRTLIELIKEGIQRKQGMNKDIQNARTYWRTQQRDPMTFTDERLQLLSPAEQQSLRDKRYATASAHLSGLTEEEKYRGGRLEDITRNIKDAKQAEIDAAREKRLSLTSDISNMRNLRGTGYTIDDGVLVKDYSGATAKDIAEAMKAVESGGSYGAKGASGENGAYQYTPETWNAYSDQYARNVLGQSRLIPMTPENQDKVTEWKVQTWLDKGYKPQQIVSMWNAGEGRPDAYKQDWRGTNDKGVTYDTPAHVAKVMNVLEQSGQTNQGVDVWSESAARGLAKKVGINATELFNNYTDSELSDMALEVGSDFITEAAEGISARDMVRLGIKNKQDLEDLLVLIFELEESDDMIISILEEKGIKKPEDTLMGLKKIIKSSK